MVFVAHVEIEVELIVFYGVAVEYASEKLPLAEGGMLAVKCWYYRVVHKVVKSLDQFSIVTHYQNDYAKNM